MIEYTPFRAGHLQYLAPQDEQRHEHAILLSSEYADIVDNNFGLSAWVGGKCIAASGIVPMFSHRAVAWAILSNDASMYMLPIVKKVRSTLALLPYQRIEMTVSAEFEKGRRFAELVGMTLETPLPLRAHGARGEDEYMYARIK